MARPPWSRCLRGFRRHRPLPACAATPALPVASRSARAWVTWPASLWSRSKTPPRLTGRAGSKEVAMAILCLLVALIGAS